MPGSSFCKQGGDLPNTPQVSTLFALAKANKLNRAEQEGGGSRLPQPATGYAALGGQGFLASSLSSEREFVIVAVPQDFTALCCGTGPGPRLSPEPGEQSPCAPDTHLRPRDSQPTGSEPAVPIPAALGDRDPSCPELEVGLGGLSPRGTPQCCGGAGALAPLCCEARTPLSSALVHRGGTRTWPWQPPQGSSGGCAAGAVRGALAGPALTHPALSSGAAAGDFIRWK